MSIAENAFVEHLRASTAIAALVSTFKTKAAVFLAEEIPSSVVAPYIGVSRISTQRTHHLGGASGLAYLRFQVDCWAANKNSAGAVANAVRSRVDGDGCLTIGTGAHTLDVRAMSVEDQGESIVVSTDGTQAPLVGERVDVLVVHRETAPTHG